MNNPIQLSGQAKRSKYIKDHLKRGAEVTIIDTSTNSQILKFAPYPDDRREEDEYERRIREDLERADKIISDGIKKAKTPEKLGVQIVIRPVKKVPKQISKQKELTSY